MDSFAEHPLWVWLDIETTGPDPRLHEILEIGTVITDPALTLLFEGSWIVNSHWDPRNVNALVGRMHNANGLWEEWFNRKERWDLDKIRNELNKILLDLKGEIATGIKPLLCGSGVAHFDRRFIETKLPNFFSGFAYYALDVGVLRRFFAWETTRKRDTLPTHRALDDCYNAIKQYRYFKQEAGRLC